MKKLKGVVRVFCILLMGFMVFACGSSDDDSGATLDPNLVGSWSANYSDDDCDVNENIIFYNDGTFEFNASEDCDGSDDYFCEIEGTWYVKNGLLYITNTYVSDPEDDEVGVEDILFYYITSEGALALKDGGDIFHLTGSSDTLYGEWATDDEDSDCNATLTIVDDNTWSYDETCTYGDEEDSSGTFTMSGDSLTLNNGTETFDIFYKLFNTVYGKLLLVVTEEELFLPND